MAHAPALSGALLPANASVLYIGQAVGAAAGALALGFAEVGGVARLPIIGAVFVVTAVVLTSGKLGVITRDSSLGTAPSSTAAP